MLWFLQCSGMVSCDIKPSASPIFYSSSVESTTTLLQYAGRRAFSIAGPRVWNLLPDHFRDPSLSCGSRSVLKTYLFTTHWNTLCSRGVLLNVLYKWTIIIVIIVVQCIFFWHASLGVRSAIRRHQPSQRAVLSQVDCFVQCMVVGSQISCSAT